jgi:hypothetical protein
MFRGKWRNQQAKSRLAAEPVKVGTQWHVLGTYPGGQQEHITGFKTEADALDPSQCSFPVIQKGAFPVIQKGANSSRCSAARHFPGRRPP